MRVERQWSPFKLVFETKEEYDTLIRYLSLAGNACQGYYRDSKCSDEIYKFIHLIEKKVE